jgi:hypothetical protein
MAHFAKLGSNSKVIQVLTLNNGDMLNADGVEDETVGQQYLERHNNWPAQMWIQTSYNTMGGKHSSGDDSKALRGNYAGIGYTWDEDNNLFYPKKPYASWVLNTTTASWHSPIGDAPELTAEQIADTSNRYSYDWNEDGQSWDLVTTPAA